MVKHTNISAIQLAQFHTIGQRILEQYSIKGVLKTFHQEVSQVLQYENIQIALKQEGDEKLDVWTFYREKEESLILTQSPESLPLSLRQSLEEGSEFYQPKLSPEEAQTFGPTLKNLGSIFGVPIRVKQKIIGYGLLGHVDPNFYDAEYREVFKLITSFLASALYHIKVQDYVKSQNEEILRQSYEYQSLVRVMPQSLFRTNLEGKFTFGNQAFLKHLNIGLESLLGATVYDLYVREVADILLSDDRWVIENEKTLEAVRTLRSKKEDAEAIHVQIFKSPIYDLQDRMIGVQSTFWDITEKQKNQDQLRLQKVEIRKKSRELSRMNQILETRQDEIEAMNTKLELVVQRRTMQIRRTKEELDIFLYRASHDLRRPLTTLMGLSQVAKLTLEQDSEALDLFEKVNMTARFMDKMLIKLLMVNEIQHISPQPKPLDFKEITEGIYEDYKEEMKSQKIRWEVKIGEVKNSSSIPELIDIILKNLVENSLRFSKTEDGDEPFIRVKVYQKKEVLHLEVEDNGDGIEAKDKPKIFGMYVRMHKRSKGNGLGLYVVKKAVNRLKGQVSVSSQKDVYTKFHVILPPQDSYPAESYENESHHTILKNVGEATSVEKAKLLSRVDALEEEKLILQALNKAKDDFFKVMAKDFRKPLSSLFRFADHLIQEAPTLSKQEYAKVGLNLEVASKEIYKLMDNLFLRTMVQLGEMSVKVQNVSPEIILAKVYENLEELRLEKGIQVFLPSQEHEVQTDAVILENVFYNILTSVLKSLASKSKVSIHTNLSPKSFSIQVICRGRRKMSSSPALLGEENQNLTLILCREMLKKIAGKVYYKQNSKQSFEYTIKLNLEVDDAP